VQIHSEKKKKRKRDQIHFKEDQRLSRKIRINKNFSAITPKIYQKKSIIRSRKVKRRLRKVKLRRNRMILRKLWVRQLLILLRQK